VISYGNKSIFWALYFLTTADDLSMLETFRIDDHPHHARLLLMMFIIARVAMSLMDQSDPPGAS